jgi:hypothetical protein
MEIEKMKECIDDMKDDLVNLKKKMRKLNRRKGQSTAPTVISGRLPAGNALSFQ